MVIEPEQAQEFSDNSPDCRLLRMEITEHFNSMSPSGARRRRITSLCPAFCALAYSAAAAGPLYQPPGLNLTYGDVVHRALVPPTSANPAAPAQWRAMRGEQPARGTTISAGAGLEYGNVQELFQFIDELSAAFRPSRPGTGGGPGQTPDPDKGIDIGRIIDAIDPDLRPVLDAIAREVSAQTTLLGLMASEGYGKSWFGADAPIAWGSEFLGGTWTTDISWSGASKAFGVAVPIEFDLDEAAIELDRWVRDTLGELSGQVPLSGQVQVRADPDTRNIIVVLDNDSLMLTKSSQLTELSIGYSREAWTGNRGRLYFGLETKLYLMRLSRFSARLGDITDSKALFQAIDNASFRNESKVSIDLGLLWEGRNYQLGMQWTNINEPGFTYPAVDVSPYRDQRIVDFLQSDRRYSMDRQLKLEASLFSTNRRWSTHLGIDAVAAADPFGDEFQWLTFSGALQRDNKWLTGLRLGYRRNLAGSELQYLSFGITAFGIVNMDLASALDTVSISGQRLPRGLMGSIGFDIDW